ncbi:MAG: prolipoprotein diacylglyceryl transferase [Planctomycetota bacterium]|nr:prolipoprotein diacylglyceryl transferase [Planctomycetota bacterium]
MEFPVIIRIGSLALHPHPVFEALAYLIGFRLYLVRRRRVGDLLPTRTRWAIVVAAIIGAAVGSKLLFWLIDPPLTLSRLDDPGYLMGGKTIVGGLMGGIALVEFVKRRLGVRVATGDLFAIPLVVGMAIGRIGCFLTGLEDNTHGYATSLPWGVDFGDGVARHPTQLYGIVALTLIGIWIQRRSRLPHKEGDLFRLFLLAYMTWRFAVDGIKPGPRWAGLATIQWAALLTVLVYLREAPRVVLRRGWEPDDPA